VPKKFRIDSDPSKSLQDTQKPVSVTMEVPGIADYLSIISGYKITQEAAFNKIESLLVDNAEIIQELRLLKQGQNDCEKEFYLAEKQSDIQAQLAVLTLSHN